MDCDNESPKEKNIKRKTRTQKEVFKNKQKNIQINSFFILTHVESKLTETPMEPEIFFNK